MNKSNFNRIIFVENTLFHLNINVFRLVMTANAATGCFVTANAN